MCFYYCNWRVCCHVTSIILIKDVYSYQQLTHYRKCRCYTLSSIHQSEFIQPFWYAYQEFQGHQLITITWVYCTWEAIKLQHVCTRDHNSLLPKRTLQYSYRYNHYNLSINHRNTMRREKYHRYRFPKSINMLCVNLVTSVLFNILPKVFIIWYKH